jgi:hypothetical protein
MTFALAQQKARDDESSSTGARRRQRGFPSDDDTSSTVRRNYGEPDRVVRTVSPVQSAHKSKSIARTEESCVYSVTTAFGLGRGAPFQLWMKRVSETLT